MGRVHSRSTREKRRHPYADAKYEIFRLEGEAFGVRVIVPDTFPTKVTSFQSRSAANRWIAGHRETVERQSASKKPGLSFQKSPRSTPARLGRRAEAGGSR